MDMDNITNEEVSNEEPSWNVQYKTVLDRGRSYIVEAMQPEKILDLMQQTQFLPYTDCRNIKELPFTTDKNRTIIDKVRAMGETGYKRFKSFLGMTRQADISEYMKSLEEGQDAPSSSLVVHNTRSHQDMRDEIIELYEKYYVKTELSPLKQGFTTHIDKIYVPLEMEEVLSSSHTRGAADTNIKTFHDVFYNNNQIVKFVFITAIPGNGKTTFCQKLVSSWCKAHTNTENCETRVHEFDEITNSEMHNRETMKIFDFLYFVHLSHMSNEAQIEDMITNQMKIDENKIKYILRSSELKCLIILDSLDEWSAPEHLQYIPSDMKGLPKADHLRNCHILVTTRPWRLASITQMNSEMHKEISIVGMTIENSKHFVRLFLNQSRNLAGNLHRSHKTHNIDVLPDKFFNEIDENDVFHLCRTPLLFKLLLCFWLECGKLQNSVCRIFGAIIDLLLENGFNKNKHDKAIHDILSTATKYKRIPKCIREFHCLKCFSEIIIPLGQFSFLALLSGTDSSEQISVKCRDQELTKQSIDFNTCSKLGIISETPVLGESHLYNKSTISFLHRSFEEFYAAIYISQDPNLYTPTILEKCSSFDKIRKYSNLYKFICGMCPVVAGDVINHIGRFAHDLENVADVDNMRRILSRIIFKIFIEILNCNGEKAAKKINMFYLLLYDNKYSTYLPYIKTSALRILDIDNVKLTHSSLRTLLIVSKKLTFVRLSSTVECIEDSRCGCQSKSDIKNVHDVSYVKVFTANGVKGLFVHTVRFNMLQELHLSNLTLHHAQITYLLIDSKCLVRVRLERVNCTTNQACGICNEKNKKYFYKFSVSRMKELSIKNGSEILYHIHTFERIEELNFNGTELSHKEMTRLFTSKNRRKVILQDVNCTKDKFCDCQIIHKKRTKREQILSSPIKKLISRAGHEILEHIHEYPKIEEIDICDIKLTHTQITQLLTTSNYIKSIKFSNVSCEPVSGCGCLCRTGDVADYQNTSVVNAYSSSVKVLKLIGVKDIFEHIYKYQRLTELEIQNSELTHTQITRLLTTTCRLQKINLHNVTCKPDNKCRCLTLADGKICNNDSVMELCSIEGGSGMFEHVTRYPKLKELKILHAHISVQRILKLLSESPTILRLTLAGIVDIDGCPEQTGTYSDAQLPQTNIFGFLQLLQNMQKGLYVTFEDIALKSIDRDVFRAKIKEIQNVEIEEFVPMSSSEMDREHSYHIKLKLKPNTVITESTRL